MQLHRPDPERRRRRLRLLAELADVKVSRERVQPRQSRRIGKVRELIALRRRLTTSA